MPWGPRNRRADFLLDGRFINEMLYYPPFDMNKALRTCLALALAGAFELPATLNAASVSLTASDASGATSFNAAGTWSNAQAPSAANDYFTAGLLLRTPATGSSNYFLGNSLSLDFNPANPVAGLAIKYPTTTGFVRVDNLKLNGGAIFNGVGGTMSVYGNITVLTNSFLDPQASGRVLAIYASISGGSTNTIGTRAASGSAGGTVQLLGDASAYSGHWKIWGAGDSVPGAILQVGNGGASGSLGSGNVTNNNSLRFNRFDNIAVSNFITGPGTVVFAGPGQVTLTAASTYTGSTTVSAGTLSLGASGSITGSSLVSLASGSTFDVSAVAGFALAPGQTLAGNGTVTGSVACASGTTLSPGDTASGTLTVNGAVTAGNCSWRWDLNAPNVIGGVNDLLVVNGNLTLTPGIGVNLVFPGGSPVAGTYTLCQCTGTLTGVPSNFTTSLGTNSATFAVNSAASPRTVTVTVNGSTPPPATNAWQIIKVYLEGGQSNADGRGLTNGLPASLLQPQADVPLYYYLTGGAANGDGTLGTLTTLRPGCSALGGGTTFGPELTFGRTLANYFAVTNHVATNNVLVAILKYAHGGTALATAWAANGTASTNGDGADYVIFQRVVSAGLARLAAAYPGATLELDGMIWVQGESDIDLGAGASAAYGTNLTRFIRDLRLTYATNQPYGTNLPFFLSRISKNQTVYSTTSDPDYPNYLLLRAGQAAVAATVTNAFLLDIDGSQFTTLTPWSGPGLHFDTAGQQAMGTAFAQAVLASLPAPRMQAPARSGNAWRLAFAGVAGTTQSLQRAPSPAGPWTLLTNIVLGPLGSATYDDTAEAAGTNAFYRASRPFP